MSSAYEQSCTDTECYTLHDSEHYIESFIHNNAENSTGVCWANKSREMAGFRNEDSMGDRFPDSN